MRRFILSQMICLMVVAVQSGLCDPFCFTKTAERYEIAPRLLKAISMTESNLDPEAVNHNRNGSIDRGHMQINSWWKKALGEDFAYLNEDPCYCTHVAAWILNDCIRRTGPYWDAVVCYHMGKSYSQLSETQKIEADRYLSIVRKNLEQIEDEKANE